MQQKRQSQLRPCLHVCYPFRYYNEYLLFLHEPKITRIKRQQGSLFRFEFKKFIHDDAKVFTVVIEVKVFEFNVFWVGMGSNL
jgi:hypothetical protein